MADDDQLKVARKMTAALAEDLELERQWLRRRLSRLPTREELAEHARRRFRRDPIFRRTVLAAKTLAENELLAEWRDAFCVPFRQSLDREAKSDFLPL